ncbi:MAG TPA: IPT/TIG domain-containing protein [Vicinamibacterales bacterium]|nr:IPT/TIG domain-containing protein [Vicinamibacterales bacterium]
MDPRTRGNCSGHGAFRTVRRGVVAGLVSAASLLGLPNAFAQGVQYVYDDAGRLISVTDPTGDTAIYQYDPVGNVLSITRTSSAVQVLYVSPPEGSVGATVTIFGTGFSAVPSQNSVAFNGTAATVTASTSTQIQTTVPVGATTGLINITTPSGSASTPTPFTVIPSQAPTVTTFAPTIGVTGTAITVNGSNFDPLASRNKAFVNVRLTAIDTATSTVIATEVPTVATSGHITVKTVHGTATSAGYFFVPPAPYGVVDVTATAAWPSAAATWLRLAPQTRSACLSSTPRRDSAWL